MHLKLQGCIGFRPGHLYLLRHDFLYEERCDGATREAVLSPIIAAQGQCSGHSIQGAGLDCPLMSSTSGFAHLSGIPLACLLMAKLLGAGRGGRLRRPLLLRMEAESEPAGRWWQSMTC